MYIKKYFPPGKRTKAAGSLFVDGIRRIGFWQGENSENCFNDVRFFPPIRRKKFFVYTRFFLELNRRGK